jgi:ABC-type amino acid transport substrate-binding protein
MKWPAMPEMSPKLRIAGLCAGWVCAAAVAVWAFGWWVPGLRHSASAALRDGRIEVIFADVPRWMTAADIAPLQELVMREAGRGAYDRVGCAQARQALLDSGWFTDVAQVRRTGSGDIVVEATFAIPFALVVDGVGEHLVDVGGRLLPRSYVTGTAPAFPRIVGASVTRPSRPGLQWTGADVSAGMALARLVESQRWRGQVTGIDVSGFRDRHVMDLLTDTGCRIVWGRAPGEEATAEVPSSQKLRYLAYLHESCGRVDAGCTSQLDLSVDYVGSR